MPGSRGIQSETSPEHRKGISLPEPHFLQHNLKGGCGTGSAMGPPSASDLPRTPEEATAQTPCNRSSRTGPWTWPFPSSVLLLLRSRQSPTSPGEACLTQDGGPPAPQPGHAGSSPAGGWLCRTPRSCGCAGNSFPFVCPSDPHLLSNCPNSILASRASSLQSGIVS